MEKANFGDISKAFDNDDDKSKDWFSFKEGQNKLRILSAGVPFSQVQHGKEPKGAHYQGRELLDGETVSNKWWMWVIDRTDGRIKIAKFGKKIVQQLGAYQSSSRFKFDSLPMPYDIIITATNAGTTEVVYTVMPDEEIELTPSELSEYEKKTPIKDITDKIREKQMKKDGVLKDDVQVEDAYPTGESDGINPADIPF